MTVSQRHGTSVVTGVNSTGYRIDRWTHQMASVNSAFSVSQSTDSPDGFANSYKIDVTTADTSLSAAHAHFFRQKIEGQNLQDFAKGTSSAKQFALSFYVKTNKTGVYTVEMYDIDNNRAISKTFTVADSNWNRYTIIFPADTTGAFDNDNGNSLVVQFFLSAGSNYTNNGTFNNSAWGSLSGKSRVSSSNVNFADSTSNNWYITGVQLEVGDTVTSFEHRNFGDELLRCYRYYYRLKGEDNKTYMIGMSDNDNVNIYGFFHFPVPMRAVMSTVEQSGNASDYKVRRDTTQTCTGVPSLTDAWYFYARVNFPRSGHGWGTGQMLWCQGGSSSSFLGFSAEL